MVYDIDQIKKILPQRYPVLMIDRVTELDPGKKVEALKNVTINDWFFEGHFPGNPVMPGTQIIEAMAQASILLYYSGYQSELGRTPDYYLGSVKVRFHKPVVPGDQLRISSETTKLLPTGAFVVSRAYVNDSLVAESELIFAVKR
jgi:beta-hydroxyacyl-ACP dehydratase FabZ